MGESQHLQKEHLFDRIYEILWGKIGSGEIASGQRLKDIEWAEILNVSRTPVREAMRKMYQEGILVPLANGGYQVKTFNETDLVNLYRCRAALEAVAAQDAALNATNEQISNLKEIVDRCDLAIESKDKTAAFELNSKFHAEVLLISQNTYVRQVCESLRKMILFYRSSVLREANRNPGESEVYLSRLRIKQIHHKQILSAINNHDGDAAYRLMELHVRETVEDLLCSEQVNSNKKVAESENG